MSEASCACGFMTMSTNSVRGTVDKCGDYHHTERCLLIGGVGGNKAEEETPTEQRLTLSVTEDEWGSIKYAMNWMAMSLATTSHLAPYESHAESAMRLKEETTALWERLDAEVRKQAADDLTREAQEMGLGYRREGE